ncbi:MAG: hypothetical protein AAGA93_27030 [Actinomycetota bacterium]
MTRSLSRQVGYVPAVAVGFVVTLAAAALLWEGPDDTACYEQAISIDIAASDALVEGCDSEVFTAVNEAIAAERTALGSDPDHEVDQPDFTAARSAQLTWIVLLSMTVGVAAATAVMTVRMAERLVGVRQRWRTWLLGIGAAVAAIGTALGILWVLSPGIEFTPYDAIYPGYTQALVLATLLPGSVAIVGLVVLCELLGSGRVDDLGSLLGVQAVLNRITGLLGALLSLAVITTGARWQMISHLPNGAAVPSTLVILYGGLFTALAAAAYLPTQRRFAERREQLIDVEAGRSGADRYSDEFLRRRKLIRDDLEAGRSPFASFLGSLSILAPLVSAAVSTLVA